MSGTVIALSGGMDSATVLGKLVDAGERVVPVIFTYGSKHNKYENEMAKALVAHYRKKHIFVEQARLIDLGTISQHLTSNLLKSGGDIPEGHYTDESMSATVVPGRNIIFLSILAGIGWSEECDQLAIGIHQGDHAIYADCRTEFFKAMDTAIYLGTDKRVEIVAPFVDTDKEGILKWGLVNNVPYHLTRTCYKDQELSCGKCGSCVERLEAWERIGLQDPICYE